MLLSDSQIDDIVKRGMDLHVHVGPDILPRRFTVDDLIALEDGKIAGMALKAHSFPTISSIAAARVRTGTRLQLVGTLTLNYFMGGFNPSAIYASAVLSKDLPVMVCFPTIHAENHLRKNYSQYEIPPEWVKDPNFVPRTKSELKAIRATDWNGRLFDKCVNVLTMAKRMGCILATGHLSWQEARQVAVEALAMEIPVIITHPYQRDIDMPVEIQKELAQKGAMIEHCYVMYLDRDHKWDYPPDEMRDLIQAIGPEHCIMTSDTGQLGNPGPSDAMKAFIKLLNREGLAADDFEQMCVRNPRKILGPRGGD